MAAASACATTPNGSKTGVKKSAANATATATATQRSRTRSHGRTIGFAARASALRSASSAITGTKPSPESTVTFVRNRSPVFPAASISDAAARRAGGRVTSSVNTAAAAGAMSSASRVCSTPSFPVSRPTSSTATPTSAPITRAHVTRPSRVRT